MCDISDIPAPRGINHIQRYAAKGQELNSTGSIAFRNSRLFDQKGPPTFFWTVNAADNYWQELHAVMSHPQGSTVSHSMRVTAVIDNPHVAHWFLTSKTAGYIQHWLTGSLDAQWYHFEYQACGRRHAHGCAKLHNDPGLCSLVNKAAEAWLREEGRIAKQ